MDSIFLVYFTGKWWHGAEYLLASVLQQAITFRSSRCGVCCHDAASERNGIHACRQGASVCDWIAWCGFRKSSAATAMANASGWWISQQEAANGAAVVGHPECQNGCD